MSQQSRKEIRYRYAVDQRGAIVDALFLAGTLDLDTSKYYCLVCNSELVAKVRGQIRQPHFAHASSNNCQPESYLHILGKTVFAETFESCLLNGQRFEVVIQHPISCRRFEEYLPPCINLGKEEKVYDLTEFFDACVIEKRDGNFIPDLKLFRKNEPQSRLYIEIAVTHFLSEEKEQSSERIIEIPMENESSLELIRSCRLTEEKVRFLNLSSRSSKVVDGECSCAGKRAFRFVVYESGKCYMEEGSLQEVISRHRPEKVEYLKLQIVDDDHTSFDSASMFKRFVESALSEGYLVQNCFGCHNHKLNFAGTKGKPIYCTKTKNRCASNEAIGCELYEPYYLS